MLPRVAFQRNWTLFLGHPFPKQNTACKRDVGTGCHFVVLGKPPVTRSGDLLTGEASRFKALIKFRQCSFTEFITVNALDINYETSPSWQHSVCRRIQDWRTSKLCALGSHSFSAGSAIEVRWGDIKLIQTVKLRQLFRKIYSDPSLK